LHIGLDAVSGEIVASTLTGRDIDDGSHVATLLDQVDGSVGVFMGDGAYDSADVYALWSTLRSAATSVSLETPFDLIPRRLDELKSRSPTMF
jgi:hypothetical protein